MPNPTGIAYNIGSLLLMSLFPTTAWFILDVFANYITLVIAPPRLNKGQRILLLAYMAASLAIGSILVLVGRSAL